MPAGWECAPAAAGGVCHAEGRPAGRGAGPRPRGGGTAEGGGADGGDEGTDPEEPPHPAGPAQGRGGGGGEAPVGRRSEERRGGKG